MNDMWYMIDSKRVECTGFAGSSQHKRYKQISEIMLDFSPRLLEFNRKCCCS